MRGSFITGEAVHRDDLDAVFPLFGRSPSHCLNTCFDRPRPCPAAVITRSCCERDEANDHGDEFVARPGMTPDVLVNAETVTFSIRVGPLIRTRFPSASTALFAVCQATPRPTVTRPAGESSLLVPIIRVGGAVSTGRLHPRSRLCLHTVKPGSRAAAWSSAADTQD